MSAKSPRRLQSAKLLLRKAEHFATVGRRPQARAAFLAAIELDAGPKSRIAFGSYLAEIDRCHEAIEQFCLILDIAHRSRNLPLKGVAANNLAVLYRELDRHSLAAFWQQRSVDAEMESMGSRREQGLPCEDLGNLANDAITAGNMALAERLLNLSLMAERKRRSRQGEAADLGSLGIVSLLQSKTERALEFFRRAYRLHSRIGDKRGAGCDLLNLAELSCRVNRRAAAIRFLRRALDRFEQAGSAGMVEQTEKLLEEATRIAAVLGRDPLLN